MTTTQYIKYIAILILFFTQSKPQKQLIDLLIVSIPITEATLQLLCGCTSHMKPLEVSSHFQDETFFLCGDLDKVA